MRRPYRRNFGNGRDRSMSKPCVTSNKPWDSNEYNAQTEYAAMRSLFFSCWACGASRKPSSYFGPWLIERAHIANKPRREDRRLVVMLCTLCHKASHRERIAGFLRPALSPGQMVALKQFYDAEWLDLEYINKHSVRLLESEPIDPWYAEERARNRAT